VVLTCRWLAASVACVVLTSCSVYDPSLIGSGPNPDAAMSDSGRMDTGTDSQLPPDDDSGGVTHNDSGAIDSAIGMNDCFPGLDSDCPMICPETCNLLDDDCDGTTDEGPNSELCDVGNADALCVEGQCLITNCLNGFSNCNGEANDGCEARLDSAEHCGICFNACGYTNATGVCTNSQCGFGECLPGYGNCDDNTVNGCETRVESLENCGACGAACGAVDNGQPGCIGGVCGVAECDTGFGDCDADPSNGCETSLDGADSCGSCSTACMFAQGVPQCAAQTCVLDGCDMGYGDCDTDSENGCEINLNTDVDNCGACGRACDTGNSGVMFRCNAGQCQVSTCPAGLEDCDGDASNGCETSVRTLTDCGSCGASCSFTEGSADCSTGSCTLSSCNTGYGNCDADNSNGCETQLNTDAACGTCTTACGVNDSRTCSGGQCSLVSCPSGQADCDNDGTTCEQSLSTLSSCGACGVRCGDAQGRLPNADASCAGGTCAVGSCYPNFDNCDGAPGNGCETSLRTTANCGGCGTACSRPNASVTCSTGACAISACNNGFANCDGNPTNGCETPTNTNQNCGGCNVACAQPNATTTCGSGTCTRVACTSGFGDCDGNAANGCEQPLNTLTHCGACNSACALANGTESCATGTCTVGTCSNGYGNCDFLAANGCETQLNSNANCTACGTLCDYANAAESCSTGSCTLGTCGNGYGNCDNNNANGCEQQLNTLTHCTACNTACTLPNATSTCSSGACAISSCNTGYGNCDNNPANGCETQLNSNTHCGACNAACGVSDNRTCSGGVCSLSNCPMGTADCDNDGTTCEQMLNTNTHCAACGVTCTRANAASSCSTGTCTLGTCNSGFDNCDMMAGNGCEQALNTTSHCGACNATCTRANATPTCGSGTCAIASCNPGFGNCDGNDENGCETPLNTLSNCGACNATCSLANAGESCSTGTCTLGTCDSGFGNCDSVASNGCEAPLTTASNCNMCGVACDYANAAESCGTGSCVFASCSGNFGNCDGNLNNGCERPTNTLSDCGGCNVACSRANAAASCGTGTCTLGACNAGFDNCDGNATNGCELTLGTLSNCGGCGDACTGNETCVNYQCRTPFPYTASNFDPNGITGTATVTLACGVTTFNSQTMAFTNWCSGQPMPSVTTRTQSGGPDVVVLGFDSFTLSANNTFKLEGDKPVILAIYGTGTINGTINASATDATSGPSGVTCNGTNGIHDADGDDGSSGGGGGGFGTGGGNSGNGHNGASGVAGGAVAGNATLTPLRGGCRGGSGGGTGTGREGGGAGGAVQISVAGTLNIGATAVIAAAGGGGRKGANHEDGGGGGGSGGAVLLEANNLSIATGAWLTANGGSGAGGNNSDSANGNNGNNGNLNNATAASGGTGAEGGDGGGGGVGNNSGGNGGGGTCSGLCLLTPDGAGGGGGGGGVGRIRLRGVTSCGIGSNESPPSSRDTGCPPSAPESNCTYRTYGGKHYYFCTNVKSWDAALGVCQGVGISLVRINDSGENAFVRSNISAVASIGANDKTTEGQWRWTQGNEQFWNGVANGTAVGGLFTNWRTGEPNESSGEDCGFIWNDDGTWNDDDCNGSGEDHPFVCESL